MSYQANAPEQACRREHSPVVGKLPMHRQRTEMIADPKRQPHQDDGASDKRRRQEEALDEALENTFQRPIRFQSSSRRRRARLLFLT
jgi:hypothetical protein